MRYLMMVLLMSLLVSACGELNPAMPSQSGNVVPYGGGAQTDRHQEPRGSLVNILD